jgi:hypothetical protein
LADDPFCPKFIDDRIIISSIAFARTSLNSLVFWQPSQLQFWQNDPENEKNGTLGETLTIQFEAFGLSAVALSLRMGASLIAADR